MWELFSTHLNRSFLARGSEKPMAEFLKPSPIWMDPLSGKI